MTNPGLLDLWHALLILGSVTAICLVIIALRHRFIWLSGGLARLRAVQTTHDKLTPRVGGIAIFSVLVAYTLLYPQNFPPEAMPVLLAAGVLFAVGLAEDFGFNITPNLRLYATAAASLLLIALLGLWLPRFGLPYIDNLMAYWFIGIPLTVLLSSGIVHSFNLIDGLNGLAALNAIITTSALGLIAAQSGNSEIAHFSLCVMLVTGGFLILNYPFGWIFLGDAGAYTLGFILVWIGIIVLINAPSVTPWAIFLSFFWPFSDTFLAIYRRTRYHRSAMLPDRLHMHHLVMRLLEIRLLGRNRRHIANPLSTAILAPFIVAPAISGVLLLYQPYGAFSAAVFYSILFWGSYFMLFRLKKHRRRKSSLR